MSKQPIGVFDSGYGGLTVLKEIKALLPQYDYLYMGDNARAPYGSRSFETVYEYTLAAVKWFFAQGCSLVILACNTASAKALRSIQQRDLPLLAPQKRVLGVIRPTAEVAGNFTKTKHIGILGTIGTVNSQSYLLEIEKFFPEVTVTQEACPGWVQLVENNAYHSLQAGEEVQQHISNIITKDQEIDTLLLACTHYPLLIDKIKQYTPAGIKIIAQGKIVAESLREYLLHHQKMEEYISKNGEIDFFTTGSVIDFDTHAGLFYGKPVKSSHLQL